MSRLFPFLVAAALVGCGATGPGERADGVVSLVPSVTEIVFAVGAGERLVGNTSYCDYPPAARGVYKVGDFANPDIERIVALHPVLVFLSLPVHRPLAEKLAELGIDCYASSPASVEDVLAEIDSIGRLLDAAPAAGRVVGRMRARLEALPQHADSPLVYAEVSAAPMMSFGGGTFLDAVLRRAGGRNLYAGEPGEYLTVDPETVVAADPDAILILHPEADAREVSSRLGWQGIAAVRAGRVYDRLDPDLLVRPGPRVVDGIVALERVLHPGE